MFKKLIVTTAVLAATGVAVANPAPYVGASAGVTINTTKSDEVSINARGLPFSVFAGYGGVLNQSFYLAGELSGTFATANMTDNGLKTTYSYGASVIPGVMLSDHTLAFARAGVVRTRFSTFKENQTGAQLGLGMQTSLTQNVDLRGEYDFVSYRSFGSRVSGLHSRHVLISLMWLLFINLTSLCPMPLLLSK
jgi:opacity protein-like surface antigen